jgi:hypothetical protein
MIRDTVARSPFLPWSVYLIPLVPMVLLYEAVQPGIGDPMAQITWYSVVMIIGSTILTRACRIEKKFDLFEPLHLAFVLFLVFYPVRALFAVWLDESWFDPSQAGIWRGLSASVLGFVCFAIGYKIVQSKPFGQRNVWLDRSWNLQRAHVIGIAFLFLGVAGFVTARLLGGSFSYFISLDPDIKSPEDIKAWFFYLLWICVFLQVGALFQLGIWLSTGRRTLWTTLYCVLALFSTFLLSRYFTVLFLMTLVICWHYLKKNIRTMQVAILCLLMLGYLGVAGLYREWTSPGNELEMTGELVELAGQQNKLVFRYVVKDLEQLSNLSEVISMAPSELPYQFGSTFTPVLFKPIPRALMPTKPLGASALFSRQLIPESYDIGLATGLGGWGEWYLNFSWPGIALGMALTGALTAAGYKAMRATNVFARVLLYASFVVVLFTWLRNDFNSAVTFGLYYLIPAVFALAYITRVKPVTQQPVQG